MQVFKLLVLSSFLLLLGSCSTDTVSDSSIVSSQKEYPGVDQRMWSYFLTFEREAAKRGVSIDLVDEEITGEIENIPQSGVAGTCHYQSHSPNHVTVDENFWDTSGASGREFVVFHELGHCSLLRGHSELKDASGNCKSIMASGTGSCNINYHSATRDTYLNELFKNF